MTSSHDATDSLYGTPLLTSDEELALFREYRRIHDPALRERLILANTRLVRATVQRTVHRRAIGSLTEADLEQEGMIGLMRAIEKYDPERGTKFSTVAVPWIVQALGRAIDDLGGNLIRVPVHAQVANRRAQRADEPLPYPPPAVLSLDEPLDPSKPQSEALGAFIPDLRPSVAEIVTETVYWHETLYVALARLAPRERLVIALRFGLAPGHGDCWTLDQIGAQLDVTRERVRQIEAKALTQLRQQLRRSHDGDLVLRYLDELAMARAARVNRARAERLKHRRAEQRASTTVA